MARAGYCSKCQGNVSLASDGACENGHSVDSISGIYEAEQAASSASAVKQGTRKAPLHKRNWFVPTAMLLAGLFVGAFLFSPAPASTSAPDAELAAQQTQVTTLQAQVASLTTERDRLKSEVASFTAAAEAEAKAVADEAARVAEEKATVDAAAKATADAEAKATADAAAAKATAAAAAAKAATAKSATAKAAAAKASVPAKKSSGGGTVYITRTGEKYHQGGCRYLSQSKIAISLADARAQGYDACSVCY